MIRLPQKIKKILPRGICKTCGSKRFLLEETKGTYITVDKGKLEKEVSHETRLLFCARCRRPYQFNGGK